MMKKIKEFFRKFWWVIFIPLIAFVISRYSKRPYSEVIKEIRDTKKDIKEKDKEIEVVKKEEEEKKKEVEKQTEKVEEVIEKNVENKEERDKKASKFFPNL